MSGVFVCVCVLRVCFSGYFNIIDTYEINNNTYLLYIFMFNFKLYVIIVTKRLKN